MNTDFAALIRGARERSGISQRELAEAIGVDHSYVSKIERGLFPPPTRNKVLAWLDKLGIVDPEERMPYLLAAECVNYEDMERYADSANIISQPAAKKILTAVEELRSKTEETSEVDDKTLEFLKEAFGEDNLDQLQELARLFARPGTDENTKKAVLDFLVHSAKPLLDGFMSQPKS